MTGIGWFLVGVGVGAVLMWLALATVVAIQTKRHPPRAQHRRGVFVPLEDWQDPEDDAP